MNEQPEKWTTKTIRGMSHDAICTLHNTDLLTEREICNGLSKLYEEMQKQLKSMTKDRDRWRDMAHGKPTTRPAWLT